MLKIVKDLDSKLFRLADKHEPIDLEYDKIVNASKMTNTNKLKLLAEELNFLIGTCGMCAKTIHNEHRERLKFLQSRFSEIKLD